MGMDGCDPISKMEKTQRKKKKERNKKKGKAFVVVVERWR